MAAYITVGAKTTHGGTVISGSPYTTHNGIPVARKGDKVICKKCKKIVTIATGDPSFIVDGSPIARAGDVTTCGSKLIAIQQSFAQSDFEVGSIAQAAPLVFPKSLASDSIKDKFDEQFEVLDENNEPMSNIKYQIIDDETEEVLAAGFTNENGLTERASTESKRKIRIVFI